MAPTGTTHHYRAAQTERLGAARWVILDLAPSVAEGLITDACGPRCAGR